MDKNRRFSRDRRSTYRLFISHSWDYNDDYYRMVDKLDEANHFNFNNYSVPEHDSLDTASDAELRRELRNQIDPVSVVIIIAGMYVNGRKWIREEMDIAEKKDKAILGVEPWGSSRIPREVRNRSDKMVGWNTQSIVKAIRALSP